MSYLQAAPPTVDMSAQMLAVSLKQRQQAKVIQDRQIHLPSLMEFPYPSSWTFKDCSWPAFFTGTLTRAVLRCFTGADAASRKQS